MNQALAAVPALAHSAPVPSAWGRKRPAEQILRGATVAAVGLAHAALFLGLQREAPEFVPQSVPEILTVSWIEAPMRMVEPAPPPPTRPRQKVRVPPRVRPAPVAPPRPRPVTATTRPAATEPSQAAPSPQPEPPAAVAAAPAEAPAAEAPAAEAPPAITPPRFEADYLSNPRPAYPPASRELGEEGRVLLRVKISPQGKAVEIRLQRGSGHDRLDQAALRAVGAWRFVPARRGSEPIEAWVQVPITFTLRN
jgi:periplasmic protein TonB